MLISSCCSTVIELEKLAVFHYRSCSITVFSLPYPRYYRKIFPITAVLPCSPLPCHSLPFCHTCGGCVQLIHVSSTSWDTGTPEGLQSTRTHARLTRTQVNSYPSHVLAFLLYLGTSWPWVRHDLGTTWPWVRDNLGTSWLGTSWLWVRVDCKPTGAVLRITA